MGNILPRLFRWSQAKDDALTERIKRIDEFQLCITSQRNHLVELFQFGGDDCLIDCPGDVLFTACKFSFN
jgi:hypothetical protein